MNKGRQMKLKNKTIVITGGTSGIGYEMVRILAQDNHVIVIARPGERLETLQKEFENIKTYGAYLSKPQEYEALADQIVKAHNQIDVLINNAAIQNTPTYIDDDFSYDTIIPEIHLNFTAVCALSYLLLPAMLDDVRECAILNINSGLALAPKKGSAIYCGTKGGMDVFSRSLGYQLEQTNIRVLQAFLPLVDTPMTHGRGTGKLTAQRAAQDIVLGIEQGKRINNIGKVKLLRVLLALTPRLARNVMKSS